MEVNSSGILIAGIVFLQDFLGERAGYSFSLKNRASWFKFESVFSESAESSEPGPGFR